MTIDEKIIELERFDKVTVSHSWSNNRWLNLEVKFNGVAKSYFEFNGFINDTIEQNMIKFLSEMFR